MFSRLFTMFLFLVGAQVLPTFEEYQQLFQKTYSREVQTQRALVYRQNIDYILQQNKNPLNTYVLGVNEWTDWTWEEFSQNRLGIVIPRGIARTETNSSVLLSRNVPNEWDWRAYNTVSEIQNQGRCGSCWAFAAISALEHKVARQYNKLYKFSEQQLVDCERRNWGCQGGYMTTVYEYMMRNNLALNRSYPYTGIQGRCRTNNSGTIRIRGYGKMQSKASSQVLQNLAYQHVLSIGIHASRDFQFYKSGVFNGNCGRSVNHAVNIVGYTPVYWIIRNSWSTQWGESGYMRLSRANGMICGIEQMVNYPIL